MVYEIPKISIIVPVYNVELYLSQCLESIERQTYKNLEIVLIDDGSTDNSGKICDEFARNHENIIVKHQHNQGLSAARNNGVAISTGEYVCFLDSDDWLAPKYTENLYELIKKYNVDIACSCYFTVWEGGNETINELQEKKKEICFSPADALEEICYGNLFGCSAPDKLFKRKLVVDNPFPVGRIYEDLATMYKIIGEGNGVAFSNQKMSYYRRRSGSIINEAFTNEHLFILKAAEEQLNYILKYFPEKRKAAETRCAYVITQITPKVLGDTTEEKEVFKQLRNKEKRYWKSLVFNNKTLFRHKLRVLSILCGFHCAKIVFKANDTIKIYLGKKIE